MLPGMHSVIHTSFTDPLQVTVKFPFNLLLSSKLQKLTPVLHTLSLFGELAADTHMTQVYTLHITSSPETSVKHVGTVSFYIFTHAHNLPRQHTQHQVEHKERANDDEGDEVHPVPCTP